MKGTDLKKQLNKEREKQSGEKILAQVKQILTTDQHTDEKIIDEIRRPVHKGLAVNCFNYDLLDTENIYHTEQLKKLCTVYRLRFLDSKLFKDNIPYEAVRKTKELQKKHQIKLKGFKILAPEECFKLKNADDPLLFAPIGNGYYYLIHKWGNDLSFWRKIRMWPLQSFENMAMTIFAACLIFTAIVPQYFLADKLTPPKFLFFAFVMFSFYGGMVFWYFMKKGKNFSKYVWKSKFFNA